MHAISAFSLLALASTAVARPTWGNWPANFAAAWGGNNNNNGENNNNNYNGGNNNAVATEYAVVTAYTTVTMGGNWGVPTAAPTAAPASQVVNVPHPPPAASPTAQASAAPSSSSSGSTGTYMDIVEKWRGKLGMSDLSQSDTLQANSLKTVQDGNGQMKHELNPGSMAQVLAPGSADEFEKVFVGGWLCERPDLPGLDGICSTMSQGWVYNGETGHADILTSKSYSKIGCALADGIWGCDLA